MFSLFNKHRPKISFVVAIYNKENCITECIESILKQDIDKEIICVDDCSTDNTFNILKEYEKKYKDIKVLRNSQNSGIVITRYNGLCQCTGEYVLFVDGDDYLLPNAFSKLYTIANEKNTDILEFCIESEKDIFNLTPVDKIEENLLTAFANKYIKNTLCNKLISRSVYKKSIRQFNIEIKHDNYSECLYFLIIFLNNAKIYHQTNIVGYHYRCGIGVTSESVISHLKHYCNFGVTYDDLCNTFGETKELFHWRNVVCNQAVSTFLSLNKAEQKKNKHELYKLMTEDEIKFLINEKRKNKH